VECSQKEGVLWKQMTHTPSDVDPGVYVLQISLTPTDSFPFPKLKLLPVLPDSSMIHRLTNTSTQQFNDSHFLSCTSTLMRFQKEIVHSHSQNMYILDSSSNSCHQQFTKRKKRVRSFPHVLSSVSLIPLVYFCNRSSTLPQTQRKILSTTKLFSTEPLTPLLTIVFFQISQKLSVFKKTRPSDPSPLPSLASSKSFSHFPVLNRHFP
jgi:hypothetical protein